MVLNLLLFSQSARAYLFPQSFKINYFCSGPVSVDPIGPQPNTARHRQYQPGTRGAPCVSCCSRPLRVPAVRVWEGTTPNSDRKTSLHKICSKGWAARAPFFLMANAVRCSKGWARWDANLVMTTGSRAGGESLRTRRYSAEARFGQDSEQKHRRRLDTSDNGQF